MLSVPKNECHTLTLPFELQRAHALRALPNSDGPKSSPWWLFETASGESYIGGRRNDAGNSFSLIPVRGT